MNDTANNSDEIKNLVEFMNLLISDYRENVEMCTRNPQNVHWRKNLVRSFSALVEGMIGYLKQFILHRYSDGKCNLSQSEYCLLKEETYDLKDNGKIKVSPKFIPIQTNIIFTFEIFSTKVFNRNFEVDKTCEGWLSFKKVVTIRNHLMHPKNLEDLNVSVDVIGYISQAVHWIYTQYLTLLGINS